MDSIEFTGDYSGALVPDPVVCTLFEAFRPSGPDHTWWGGISLVGFAPVEGMSVSGTADITINDTTGTLSIDYYVGTINTQLTDDGLLKTAVDSSVGHSITVVEIPTAVDETTWGVLKSRR